MPTKSDTYVELYINTSGPIKIQEPEHIRLLRLYGYKVKVEGARTVDPHDLAYRSTISWK